MELHSKHKSLTLHHPNLLFNGGLFMRTLEFIRCQEIDKALSQEYRQYLSGRLIREQKYLRHIDDDIEVGLSHYVNFTADKPHMHPIATEHAFVLCGSVRIRLLDGSNQEFQFDHGDYFTIRPGVGYASKNKANTKVLFIKSPGGNDKLEVSIDNTTRNWLSSWD